MNQKARPLAYQKKESIASSYASRTMMWSGPILAAFIVYHLLHFTVGVVHPNFQEGHVYDNVIAGFRVIPVSIAYIVAMVLLGLASESRRLEHVSIAWREQSALLGRRSGGSPTFFRS